MVAKDLPRRLVAEALGTLLLLATVVGSGIMAEGLAGGNDAIALIGNTLATGAILAVLVTLFGPLSGAHFNPAVTMAFLIAGRSAPPRPQPTWPFNSPAPWPAWPSRT